MRNLTVLISSPHKPPAQSRSFRAAERLAIGLLLAACARGGAPASTSTPRPASPAPTHTAAPPASPTPGRVGFTSPLEAGPKLLDLAVLEAGNLDRLAPFQQLAAGDLPDSISTASLAFYPSYEYQLVGHLDDGQLLVWDMATGEAVFRDQRASADSHAGQHPALAVDPSFQRYLATSEALFAESGPATASGTAYRRPDDPLSSFLLSGAGGPPGTASVRVHSIAYSPDGHRLASSLSGGEGGTVQIWNVWEREDRGLVQEIAFGEPAAALLFTPDGTALVCAVGRDLIYLDPNSGAEQQRRSLGFPILGLALSTSGASLAVWGEQAAVVQSVGLPDPLDIRAFDHIRRVEFWPEGRLAVVADGDSLRFWDLATGLELTTHLFQLGPPDFLDVRILDNGRVLATIDERARVFLWGVPRESMLPQARARISPANAAAVVRGAGLYLPRTFDARLTANTQLLAVGTSQGIFLADLPGLQLRRLLPLHGLGFTAYDVSADGTRLAWLEREGTIRVWDLEADRLESEISGLRDGCCWQIVLTPGYLSTVADLVAQVWDLETGLPVYLREGVQAVHASPDGSRLAFDHGLEVHIVEAGTWRELVNLTGFTTAAPIITTRFSPDWSAMYWVGRASMQFAEVQSGRLGPAVDFSWGAFSPDGARIVVVEEGWIYATVGQAHLLDVRSGETLAVLDHREDAIIQAAAYSPDGRLIATALGQSIKLWDASSGAELATLAAGGGVHHLAFSADGGLLLSVSGGELIELWAVSEQAGLQAQVIDVASAGSLVPVDSLRLDEAATDAVFSRDQRAVAVSTASGAVWTWDLAGGGAVEAASSEPDWIYHLAYAPDGSGLASVSMGGYIRFQTATNAYAVGMDTGEMSGLAFLPLGARLATAGEDRMLRLWSMPSFGLLKSVEAHASWIWGVAASPNGDLLATASADRSVKLWRVSGLPAGEPGINLVRTLSGHTETVWAVAFSPDGRSLASASWDRTVRLWDAAGGGQLRVLRGHTDWVYDVAFSPAGDLLASSSADGTIRLWNTATGDLLATLPGSGRVWSVEFSPDGRFLVSASGAGEVVLWGVAP